MTVKIEGIVRRITKQGHPNPRFEIHIKVENTPYFPPITPEKAGTPVELIVKEKHYRASLHVSKGQPPYIWIGLNGEDNNSKISLAQVLTKAGFENKESVDLFVDNKPEPEMSQIKVEKAKDRP